MLVATHAYADCAVVVSPAQMDLGRLSYSTLAPTDAQGLKKVGQRTATLTVTCTTNQPALKLAFSGLQAIPDKSYAAWGQGGAMKLTVGSAAVEGMPVNIAIEGLNSGQYAPSVELNHDAVVMFDTSRVPVDRRKTYALQVQFSAALSAQTRVTSEQRFDGQYNVQVVGAQ
ncbi:hypothetical protein WT83_04835 [Burkholderia territorii]|uniref:Spore coat protein U domain-containing protein n=1 Tax=Burkholderia territorii TaxID=1503055 RepID=A0A108F2R1_9BURK|nr:hypothetical protein WT83_04835 [Burkholderia territorii]